MAVDGGGGFVERLCGGKVELVCAGGGKFGVRR